MKIRPVQVTLRDSYFQNEFVAGDKKMEFLELLNDYGFVKLENASDINNP
jgi:hypothetical protein